MKITKKVLSVLLAVIMMVSSMSVCFGTISFAVTDDTQTLVDLFNDEKVQTAMKNFTVTANDATRTGSAGSTSIVNGKNSTYIVTRPFTVTAGSYDDYTAYIDVIKKLDIAIQSLAEYNSKHTHVTDSTCGGDASKCTDFTKLKTALINDMTESTYNELNANYKLGTLVDTVLNMNFGQYGPGGNNQSVFTLSSPHDSGTSGHSTVVAQEVHNILTVSLTYDAFIKSFSDPDDIPGDMVNLSYEYKTSMGRQNYSKQVQTGSIFGRPIYSTKYYYHSAVNTQQIGSFSTKTNGTETSTNKAVLTAMKAALVNNKSYLDKTTIAGVHEISTNPTELNAAATEIETAYNDLGSVATYFNHFFNNSTYSNITYAGVPTLVALIKKAATFSGYESICKTIEDKYALYANETYKTYSSTEVNTLYNELKTAYEGFKAADDSLESEIAEYYGIDDIIGNVPKALDDLLAYYYEIFLGSIKERAFGDNNNGYISKYSSWTVEDIDNDVITSADILTALNEVTLDINTLTTDATEDDIQGYFGITKAELLAQLEEVKEHLEELGYYAGLNDELYAQYNSFTNNISSVIDADSSKLYDVLSGYEQWHKDLQTFFTTWETEVGDYKDLLEDDLQATMNAYMTEAYAALKARVVTQIDNAYGLYEVYYDMYGNNVTMASLTYFNTLKKAIEAIEHDAYNWMLVNHETYGDKIDDESIRKYNALQVIYGAYGTFVANRGFDTYTQTVVDTVREDTADDIARENADIDNDNIGEYEVTDENIENIIELLEAALADEEIKALLGSLVNKDEDGNPTGEAFDLAQLINGLIEGIYTDDAINGIIQLLYPIVAKAFLDVWEGINPIVETTADVGVTVDIYAKLALYDVDTAIEATGVALAPANLGNMMAKNSTYATKYADVIATLKSVTAKTRYNADGEYVDPWQSNVLFTDAVDENGDVIIDEETGTAKQVYALDWGIDEAEDKRAAFIDAACAALSGLEPLLYALILNQSYTSPNIEDPTGDVRGGKIGVSAPGSTASYGIISADLTLDPITLMLDISANDGWDNVLAPIFEALGLTNIPHSEDMKTTRDFFEKGLFAMIDQLVDKVAKNPLETILDIIPNLVYALEADLVAPLLNFLETNINYYADVHYNADILGGIDGDLKGVLKSEKPAYINVGEMLDLESMGVDLSSGLAGLLDLIGIEIPMPDVSVLATAGELVWNDTNRSKCSYTYQPDGVSGKAAHIKANRADVLEYLVKYVLSNLNGLLSAFNVDTSTLDEAVTEILDNLANNADAATAGVVELLNQKIYNTLENYEWFNPDTYALPTVEGFTPATQLYMNPGNDWTKDKATYLYNNLETILSSILTMAGADFNIEAELQKAIGGLYTNANVTALAKLLGGLDLNALVAGESTEGESTEGESTEGESTEEAAIDLNALIKDLVGIDFGTFAQYKDIADDYNWGFTDGDSAGFVTALVNVLAPFKPVLDFILTGENIEITLGTEKVSLLGYDGYNNAFVPLLEALGCDVKALSADDNALEVILNALVKKINTLTTNDPANEKDGALYGIIELLPGVIYFLSSNALSTAVRNLLQPIYVILDTIRPIYDVDLNELLAGIEVNGEPLGLDLNSINTEFVIGLVSNLTGLNLSGINTLIYDVCKVIGVEYDSVSTLENQDVWKKGAYSTAFDQADMLTVILSFVLEWLTVDENAKALDEMLDTDGIIDALDTVFADIEITYGTPDWMYWFSTQEEFDAYVNGGTEIPSTLAALTYPNDWTDETAQYLADNIADLADTVVGLVSEDYDTLAALIEANVNVFTAENLDKLVALITDLLGEIDANLIDAAGRLLDVDLTGLTSYKAPEDIDTASEFAAELANVLTTYANGLVEWLFLGNDYRFAKKSDSTDTIVINGGEGYAEGLALILEALDCKNLPAADGETKAVVSAVLDSLAKRIEEILENPVEEALDLLPNLVYFLNANGAGVAVDNLLQPVYALLTKLEAFGVELDLDELLGFELKDLSLNAILTIVEDKVGLDLTAAKEILVDFCVGKIESYDSVSVNPAYKMAGFSRKDVITVLLTTALLLVENEQNAKTLDEMLGTEIVSALKSVFESTPVSYVIPDWDYCWAEDGIDYDNATVEVMEYAITYPNNWTEESAKYVADNLGEIGDMIAGLIDSNYDSLGALVNDKVKIYTGENINAIVDAITGLLGDIDAKLLEAAGIVLDVDLNGLAAYEAPAGEMTAEEFAAELTDVLTTYANGVVEWLLLGNDFTFFVDDANADGVYGEGEDIITINGGHGYAEGLALVLEALGVENLPNVYDTELTTKEIVNTVLTATFARLDEILADPVTEVFDLLPNLLYFLNANGVAAAVDNLLGAVNALLVKLEAFGVEVDINSLINIEELLGIEKDLSISLDNLTIAAILELVSELTGLKLTALEDVLVGFALGEVKAYQSVSRTDVTYKMYYHDDFAKYDMITVLATCVIMAVEDDANADKLKELLGEDIYQVILNIFNMGEVPVQEFDWKFTDKADTGYAFSAINTSELYENHQYGPLYTEEMAQYIADNIGEFIDNVIYLLGISINGTSVDSLKELINEAVNGSLYNSANVVAIRDALAGVLKGIGDMDGGEHIKAILKSALGVDLDAVANVNVPEFEEDRAKFTKYLCEVLEPLYPVLEWVLADEDIAFFVDENKDDAIKLFGAEGYAYGIIPLLEVLECENILTPDEYYAAVEADSNVVITAILNPLLDRVDVIMEDPAQAILSMLPNLIYFINSNGVDTVVKNTLNAVYSLLNAIEPIAKIDLYELIGLDLSTLTFEKLFQMALDMIADATGYEFSALDASAVAELTVGTLVSHTSKNGKTAYKMVYQSEAAKAEMVTVVMRLIVTFIMHENNREMLLGLLRDYLNMNEDAEKYIRSVLDLIATCATETYLGMDKALATLYYIFYGTDIAVGETADGLKDVNAKWQQILKDMGMSDDPNEKSLGNALADFLDTYFEDVITSEGIAPNGFIAFFQKIIDWFNKIIEWFKNLFS